MFLDSRNRAGSSHHPGIAVNFEITSSFTEKMPAWGLEPIPPVAKHFSARTDGDLWFPSINGVRFDPATINSI